MNNNEIKEVSLEFDYKKLIKPTIILGIVTSIVAITYMFADQYTLSFRSPFQNPIIINERTIEIEYKEPEIEATSEAEPTKTSDINILYSGKISYYDSKGCLGCKEHYDENGDVYYKTGNGDIFDENALTLAIPCEDIISGKYKYNTKVKLVNQDNLRASEAVITDCGGFSKYDRVADLSLGLAEKLEATTDKSEIVIYK